MIVTRCSLNHQCRFNRDRLCVCVALFYYNTVVPTLKVLSKILEGFRYSGLVRPDLRP